jgi:hypothetical protein
MQKYTSYCLAFLLTCFSSTALFSQHNFFTDAGADKRLQTNKPMVLVPEKFRTTALDIPAMKSFLWSLPSENAAKANRNLMQVIELPMPDGTMAQFRVWESSIQAPELEAKFPGLKTFAGQGIDDPYAVTRFVFGPLGFNAIVLTPKGTYYVAPYTIGEANDCISYYENEVKSSGQLKCATPAPENTIAARAGKAQAACRGTELRKYRLAIACTGEYARAFAPLATDSASVHNRIINTINNTVALFEKELSVTFELAGTNGKIVFLDPAADPYSPITNLSQIGILADRNQAVIDSLIGSANYDIGHVFTSVNLGGGGGIVLGGVCQSATKARAASYYNSPTPNDPFFHTDIVAHEIAHQFTASHTFNSNLGFCAGQRAALTAFEPGGGASVMAYSSVCGSDALQAVGFRSFHPASFDNVSDAVSSGIASGCGTSSTIINALPVIDPLQNNGVSIPPGTPFTLSGFATDPDPGSSLTYSWDQMDLGAGPATWNSGATAPDNNTEPLFKSIPPKTTGTRTFPDMAVILAGYPANPAIPLFGTIYVQTLKGETLSPVARPMKFRLTVRDNRAGGGGIVSSGTGGCQSPADFQINVAGTTPFTVSVPNGAESYPAGSTQTITWNTAGTANSPYNASNVRILLSSDGGLTYPTTIVASTPNDGTQAVTIPASVTPTAAARIKIEAVENIFFDISNANFSITPLVLPVDLTAFKGSLQGKNALLQWITSAEYNSRHFELEKSFDGISFLKIATVPAAGNSNSPLHYFYIDKSLLTEKNYYRLKSVDMDYKSKLSDIILLKRTDAKQDMLVIGNTFTNSITVRFIKSPEIKGELRLTNMTGQLIAKQRIAPGEQQLQFMVPDLKTASGAYILQAVFGKQQFTATVIKK